MKKKRVWEIDFMRGIAILLVVVDHAFFDLGYSFAWQNCGVGFLENLSALGKSYINGSLREFWRPAFLFLFFFTSGLCTAFSRDNFFRGVKLLFVALCVTLVTYTADKFIGCGVSLLGVLHCLSIVILSYSLVAFLIKLAAKGINKLRKKPDDPLVERILHIVVCMVLGIVFLIIHIKFNVKFYDATSQSAGLDTENKVLGLFFYCDNWWIRTMDYFPLFPYISFFYLGAAFTRILYEKRRSLLPMLDGNWHAICTFPGRHSLIFYLAGQVVCVAFCAILNIAFLGGL